MSPQPDNVTRIGGRRRGLAAWALSALLAGLLLGDLAPAPAAAVTQPSQTYQSIIAANAPVTDYRFDDAPGASTLSDSAGGDTATNSGITTGTSGPFAGSKAGSFGGGAYAAMASDPLASATAFTLEAWVDWNGPAAYGEPVLDLGSSTSSFMSLTPAAATTGHPLTFEIRNGGADFRVTAPELGYRSWHYVVVTGTGATVTIYVDGKQAAQATGITVTPSALAPAPNDWLGRSENPADPPYAGKLSNVAFYPTALTAAQVLAHYNAAEFPVSASIPVISGTATAGQTLSTSSGRWSGVTPMSYSYQWERCGSTGSGCAAVPRATTSTYQLTSADVGSVLKAVVTATNSAGSGAATSHATAIVAPGAPVNTVPPSIAGTASGGDTLTASPGTWGASSPISFAYQWESCDSTGANCWEIAGATGVTYTIGAWEAGSDIEVSVSASNNSGSTVGTSPALGPVSVTGPPATTYFPASFWDQPIPADAPLDPQSAEMSTQLYNEALGLAPSMPYYNCRRADYLTLAGHDYGAWSPGEMQFCHQVTTRADIATSSFTPTLYTVGPGQATVPVTMPHNTDLQAAMSAVPIPPGAVSSAGSDAQMIIWQPSTDTMWELWQAHQDSSGNWDASWGGRIENVSTDPGYYRNVRNTNSLCSTNPAVKYCESANWGGPSARVPNLPGLMTTQQVQSGQIDHALVLALPSNVAGAWSWPAQNTDGTGNSIIPQGARIEIDPSLDLNKWFASLRDQNGNPRPIAPIEMMIAKAMQTYGAIVANTSSSVSFYAENWTPSGDDIYDGPGGLFGSMQPFQFTMDLPWEHTQVLQTNMCNAITPGSGLYQTSCNPPQYVTINPNPPATNPCAPPLAVKPQPGQTTGPSITITSPTGPSVGSQAVFSAIVTDPSGVTSVDFKVDGQLRYVSNFPHCAQHKMQYTMGGIGGFWDAESELPLGNHTLEVDAYNSLGIESTATETVNNG
jgi:hypothetical protein